MNTLFIFVLFYFKRKMKQETVQEQDIGGECSSLYKSELVSLGKLYFKAI